MNRYMLSGIIVIATLVATARATEFMILHDDVDDNSLVDAISEQEPVKKLDKVIDPFVKTFWPRYGQIEFASNAPSPRIITLNKPCALARASAGKYASTKI